jgi:hypothetical protein
MDLQEPAQPASPQPDPPSTQFAKIFLGVTPLVLTGLTCILLAQPANYRTENSLGGFLFIGGYLIILVGLALGALRGFPRWAHAYPLYAVFFPLYLSQGSTPGLVFFNVEMWGREVWGWRAWVPLALTLLLIMLLTRSPFQALLSYWRSIRQDWTQLAFGIYNLLPFILLIFSDEVEISYVIPVLSASLIVLLAGALMYLTAGSTLGRMAALLSCAFLAVSASTAMNQVYWQTHLVNFGTGERRLLDVPLDVGRLILNTLSIAAYILVLLLLPGLLGLLPALQDSSVRDYS